MPYIHHVIRTDLNGGRAPSTPGELNYTITNVLLHYIEDKGLSYGTINDIMGAMSSAQAEFYRRVAVPYEDMKIRENGDVYPDRSGICD